MKLTPPLHPCKPLFPLALTRLRVDLQQSLSTVINKQILNCAGWQFSFLLIAESQSLHPGDQRQART